MDIWAINLWILEKQRISPLPPLPLPFPSTSLQISSNFMAVIRCYALIPIILPPDLASQWNYRYLYQLAKSHHQKHSWFLSVFREKFLCLTLNQSSSWTASISQNILYYWSTVTTLWQHALGTLHTRPLYPHHWTSALDDQIT